MSELIETQKKFQNYLFENKKEIHSLIIETKKVSAEDRLFIYRNAYQMRLIDSLADSYSALKFFLGDDLFEELANIYIQIIPSHYRSIRWYGDQFSDFLNTHHRSGLFPYLAELAKVEWTMASVFDAADSSPIDLQQLSNIPPDAWANMKLIPHPSTQMLKLHWSVMELWQSISQQETEINTPELYPTPIHWIFWRKELTNQFCSLDEIESWAIRSMCEEKTFGEICEGLCQWIEEEKAAMHAASLLKGWIDAGLIVGWRFD